MRNSERRKFKRLPIRLDLSCRKVDSAREEFHTGCTLNVSPGGVFFETPSKAFKPGNVLKVELSIPPTEGLLEFGGRITSFARVLRTSQFADSHTDAGLGLDKYGVALEFSQPPKLCT